jgi:HD-like signal output (HDOD) protein
MGKKVTFPCKACKAVINLDLRSNSSQDDAPPSEPTIVDEDLKNKILKSVGNLPPMPQTVHKAREIMDNPSSSFQELAQVIETDQAVAAKVLKLANSTYYGLSGKVSSVQHASVVLGQKTLGELISVAGTSDVLDKTLEGYGMDSGDLWRHSIGVAFGSRMIAKKINPALLNDAFSVGLIHDGGKLILDKYIFERKEIFEEFLADEQKSFLDAEKELLGFDHSEIASEVCKNWNIPEALITAIKYHHSPLQAEGDQLAYIVHMADAIAMMTGLGIGMDGMQYKLDDKAMEILGLQEEDVGNIMTEVAVSVENTAEQMHNI